MIITLRVRGPEKVHRILVDTACDTMAKVYDSVSHTGNDDTHGFYLSYDPAGAKSIPFTTDVKGFENGAMVYQHYLVGDDDAGSKQSIDQKDKMPAELDKILSKRDGKQRRTLNKQMCRHGPGGMCEHCQPLEPWQANADDKHLPLHAWLRREKKSFTLYLSDLQSSMNHQDELEKRCKHPERERCINCTKQTTIQLKMQEYRSVDHIELSMNGIEQIVQTWRSTGLQCFAYLLGKFVPVDDSNNTSDLRVKGTVVCTFHPEQESGLDGVRLTGGDDQSSEISLAVQAARAAFSDNDIDLIGCVWTDLTDDGSGTGKVLSRGYILSASELAFMAQQQIRNFRFVTVVVTGSESGTIEPYAYMASDLAVNLFASDTLLPSVDEPDKAIVASDSCEFTFTERNAYGYNVQSRAKQGDLVPIEYFIVSVAHGFPTGDDQGIDSFPPVHMHPTNEQAIEAILSGCVDSFNLMHFLARKFGVDRLNDLNSLCEELMLMTHNRSENGGVGNDATWTCTHCTYINENSNQDCAMCGLPKA